VLCTLRIEVDLHVRQWQSYKISWMQKLLAMSVTVRDPTIVEIIRNRAALLFK